jgi:hemerythrin-like domain-containing protein
MKMNRRNLLSGIGGFSTGMILSSYSNANGSFHAEKLPMSQSDKDPGEEEVSAVEDLMREHGILRRALFIYSESAAKIRSKPSAIVFLALHKTARLFRDFGEDYHEKKLEEAYIFPEIKKVGGALAVYPDILVAQHSRGREITDYILTMTQGAKLNDNDAGVLANAMDSFVRMYRPHAAREDTIVFPGWKEDLTTDQLDEMSEKFEEIEHQQFGEGGFEKFVLKIAAIEAELGMADLKQFTAPAPAM